MLRSIAARLLVCSLSLTASVASARGAAPATAPSGERRPSVIFILADDLGYGDVGCYGQQRIKTPHLDQMAAQGLRFTDAYAGAPVCAPSRCVLMTGMHVGHARVRGNTPATEPTAALQADDVTVAQVLKNAGYTTALIGKWGLGEPTHNVQGLPGRLGFDYFYGYLKHGHAHNYYTDYLWRTESRVKLPNGYEGTNQRTVATKKVQYSHDLFAEEGLKFVQEHADRPFFLYWAFTIPHANNEAGEQGMEVPDYGDYKDVDWPEPQKGHAAMISRMDRDIGRMFTLLEELKIDDDTLVIFASDNGPHPEGGVDPAFNDSNGPLRGQKGNVTEGGIRVPFIVRWPGRVAAGTTADAPISFADVLPTLADLGGAETPSCLDGLDFAPTLLGRPQPELSNRFLYWEFYKFGVQAQSARWGDWKAVRDPKSESIELYDLSKDVAEANNVAAEHPDVVQKFAEYFSTARTETPQWPMAGSKPPANAKAAKSSL
ncbi:MAG: arylsulfatase [Pirellulales bacterium]|nr:arylsulfatase [Pirellulales bacterium]